MPAQNQKEKIYLDTFVFMDILSGDDTLVGKAAQYLEEAKKNGAIVSSIIFTELAYHLRRRRTREKVEEILFYIKSIPGLEIAPVSEEIAKLAGLLRAKYRRLKLPKKFTYLDCVHIATALTYNCSKFVTGDRGFKDIKEITVEVY
jgi:predicted nucleic acid-binding protein